MTQQEFKNRTGVEISYQEFNAIHEVYVNSDLDKDGFCKMWVKMNTTRVAQAKVEAERQAEKEAMFEMMWNIIMEFGSIATCSDEMHTTLAINLLTEEQQKNLASLGIDMTEDYGYAIPFFKRMSTVLYEIDKILKAA